MLFKSKDEHLLGEKNEQRTKKVIYSTSNKYLSSYFCVSSTLLRTEERKETNR